MAQELPPAVAAIVERIRHLPEREQLQAYEAIGEYLAAGTRKISRDPELAERIEALRVMQAVVDHYRLRDATKLTVKQFDAAPDAVRDGWSSSRVIRAFATWRFARDALAGARPRETARQRSLRSARGITKLRVEDYLSAVRAWLATDPPTLTARAYNDWARDHREPDGALPLPNQITIRRNLRLGWEEVLRVARGEITLASAARRAWQKTSGVSSGEHDLVTTQGVGEMAGKGQAWFVTQKPGFPRPVVVIGDYRYWLRSDVKAFLDEEEVPERTENELGHLYVNGHQAAEILGLRPESVLKLRNLPEPVFKGVNRLWRRADIEALRDERKRVGVRRGRRGYGKE